MPRPRKTAASLLLMILLASPCVGQNISDARDALDKYSSALQSLDANAVKKVQPSINADNLAKAFRAMRELKVEIDDIKVLSMDVSTMRVSCRVTQTLTPKAGSRQTSAVSRVIRLRRDAGIWVIDAFER